MCSCVPVWPNTVWSFQVWRVGGHITEAQSLGWQAPLMTGLLFEETAASIQAEQALNTQLCQFLGDFTSHKAVV